jgi:hypothetical protein
MIRNKGIDSEIMMDGNDDSGDTSAVVVGTVVVVAVVGIGGEDCRMPLFCVCNICNAS